MPKYSEISPKVTAESDDRWGATEDPAGTPVDIALTPEAVAKYIRNGVSGGQTFNGGTAAAEKLILKATSHASGGDVEIDTAGNELVVKGGGASTSTVSLEHPAGTTNGHLIHGKNGDSNIIFELEADGNKAAAFVLYDQTPSAFLTAIPTGLIIAGYIRMGTTGDTTAGNIRYSGSDLEGSDGSAWRSLTGSSIAINNTSTGSYTLVAGDAGKLVKIDSDLTIPTGLAVGFKCKVFLDNGTKQTLTTTGLTTKGADANTSISANGVIAVTVIASNTVLLEGNMEA